MSGKMNCQVDFMWFSSSQAKAVLSTMINNFLLKLETSELTHYVGSLQRGSSNVAQFTTLL